MDEFVRWLGEQLDEDERIAREAGGLAWSRPEDPGDPAAIRDSERERVVYDEGWPSEGQAVHIAEWDPARVLREIDAKRQIINLHGGDLKKQPMFCGHCEHDTPCPTLRLLALPYADRPAYRSEWAPAE